MCLRRVYTAMKSFSSPAVVARAQVCNGSDEGRSWQGTGGVVQGTLLIFTRPWAQACPEEQRGLSFRQDGCSGPGSGWKRCPWELEATALAVTAARDSKQERATHRERGVRIVGRMYQEVSALQTA